MVIFLSISFKSAATVPGLGLKMKEYELINLILLIKANVSSKSWVSSPGYPMIKSLENSMLGFIFFNLSNISMYSFQH